MTEIYEKLTQRFAEHHLPGNAGATANAPYITGEQAVTRLNEVLGYDAWSFRVVEHGVNAEADEIWVLGELQVRAGMPLLNHDPETGKTTLSGPVIRQQFGSQKIKRSRNSGQVLDLGFDLKGATTDALKKCATLIGVGLYLTEKDAPREQPGETRRETSEANAEARGRRNKWGLPTAESDPMTEERRAMLLTRMAANHHTHEGGIELLLGCKIDEWCQLWDTGYAGLTMALNAHFAGTKKLPWSRPS